MYEINLNYPNFASTSLLTSMRGVAKIMLEADALSTTTA